MRRGRRRWRRTRGPLNAAGAGVEVGERERPTSAARGSVLPGDAEWSERGKFEARSRPPSRGSSAVPGAGNRLGCRMPLLPFRSISA
ncbi:hypothetical protein NDU88_007689 [Pleurodeles waltl]|uniref:Uncharacterized protein n=1 Tax=Pleurodeles waltl TaxID=8319 RepID=A0AAV7QPU6_PLEWA|nr:hypothetical protein NDU88_007689 [Pleurodeles waltl]